MKDITIKTKSGKKIVFYSLESPIFGIQIPDETIVSDEKFKEIKKLIKKSHHMIKN